MLSKRFQNDHRAVLSLNEIQKAAKEQIEEKVGNGRYAFEKTPCCVCGESNFELLSEKDAYGLYCPVVICKMCGLVQQNPRMSQRNYDEFYDKEYRNLYDGESGHDAMKNYFYYQERVKGARIYKYIEEKPGASLTQKKIFEIGCAAGGILQYFQKKGNTVFGIDSGSEYVEYGRKVHGLDLRIESLNSVKLPWKPDIVICNNIVEHLLDPVKELGTLRSLIMKDTLLYIEVPGVRNLAYAQSYGSDFLRFLENAHTYYFTLTSLKNVLWRAGYDFVSGDDGIHSIFKLSLEQREDVGFQSDYNETRSFLQETERRRLFFTPELLFFYGKLIFLRFLKSTGLFHFFFQKIYYKMIYR